MKVKHAISILPMTFLLACASDQIIVDKRGLDPVAYERDLAECRSYGNELDVGAEMARGAAVGATAGVLLGAIIGDSDTAAAGAGVGAVHGGFEEGRHGAVRQQQVVKRCLRGRGYSVLN